MTDRPDRKPTRHLEWSDTMTAYSQPIAYTYEADTHCVDCAIARFGAEPGHPWVADDATDHEGNPIGAIFPWDEWHEDEPGTFRLVCGTCWAVMDECDHGSGMDEDPDACDCDSCIASGVTSEAEWDQLAEQQCEFHATDGAQGACICPDAPMLHGRPRCTECGRAWDDNEHAIFGGSPTFHGYHEPVRGTEES